MSCGPLRCRILPPLHMESITVGETVARRGTSSLCYLYRTYRGRRAALRTPHACRERYRMVHAHVYAISHDCNASYVRVCTLVCTRTTRMATRVYLLSCKVNLPVGCRAKCNIAHRLTREVSQHRQHYISCSMVVVVIGEEAVHMAGYTSSQLSSYQPFTTVSGSITFRAQPQLCITASSPPRRWVSQRAPLAWCHW